MLGYGIFYVQRYYKSDWLMCHKWSNLPQEEMVPMCILQQCYCPQQPACLQSKDPFVVAHFWWHCGYKTITARFFYSIQPLSHHLLRTWSLDPPKQISQLKRCKNIKLFYINWALIPYVPPWTERTNVQDIKNNLKTISRAHACVCMRVCVCVYTHTCTHT